MRKLSFKGFLSQYVRTLSYANTNSISRLTQEATTTNVRLREPLLLFALWTEKNSALKRNAEKYGLQDFYGPLLFLDRLEAETALCNNAMPADYQKVWNSFQRYRDRFVADDRTKTLIRNKVIKIQAQKNISNYRIYTDLKLNPGNLNTWLKYGQCKKVSLDTARAVLNYLN